MKAIALQRKTFFISISLWCILTTDAQGHLIIIGKGSDLFRLNTYFLLDFGDLKLLDEKENQPCMARKNVKE